MHPICRLQQQPQHFLWGCMPTIPRGRRVPAQCKFQATRTWQHRHAFVLVRVGQERPFTPRVRRAAQCFFRWCGRHLVRTTPLPFTTPNLFFCVSCLLDNQQHRSPRTIGHSATLLTNKVDSITIQYSGSLFPGGINVTARRPSSCQRSSAPR